MTPPAHAGAHIGNAIANETDRVFFRPSANGAPQDGPGGQNQGFLIDALSNSVYQQRAAPATISTISSPATTPTTSSPEPAATIR